MNTASTEITEAESARRLAAMRTAATPAATERLGELHSALTGQRMVGGERVATLTARYHDNTGPVVDTQRLTEKAIAADKRIGYDPWAPVPSVPPKVDPWATKVPEPLRRADSLAVALEKLQHDIAARAAAVEAERSASHALALCDQRIAEAEAKIAATDDLDEKIAGHLAGCVAAGEPMELPPDLATMDAERAAARRDRSRLNAARGALVARAEKAAADLQSARLKAEQAAAAVLASEADEIALRSERARLEYEQARRELAAISSAGTGQAPVRLSAYALNEARNLIVSGAIDAMLSEPQTRTKAAEYSLRLRSMVEG